MTDLSLAWDPDGWKKEARMRDTIPDRELHDIVSRLTGHVVYGGAEIPDALQQFATSSPEGACFDIKRVSYYPKGVQLFLLAQYLRQRGHNELAENIQPNVSLRFEPTGLETVTLVYTPEEGSRGPIHRGILRASGPVEMYRLGDPKTFTVDMSEALPRMMILRGVNNIDKRAPTIYTFDETFSSWSLHTT